MLGPRPPWRDHRAWATTCFGGKSFRVAGFAARNDAAVDRPVPLLQRNHPRAIVGSTPTVHLVGAFAAIFRSLGITSKRDDHLSQKKPHNPQTHRPADDFGASLAG